MAGGTHLSTAYILALSFFGAIAALSACIGPDAAHAGGVKPQQTTPTAQPAQAKFRYTGSCQTRFVTPRAGGQAGALSTTEPNASVKGNTENAGQANKGKHLIGTYRPQFYFR